MTWTALPHTASVPRRVPLWVPLRVPLWVPLWVPWQVHRRVPQQVPRESFCYGSPMKARLEGLSCLGNRVRRMCCASSGSSGSPAGSPVGSEAGFRRVPPGARSPGFPGGFPWVSQSAAAPLHGLGSQVFLFPATGNVQNCFSPCVGPCAMLFLARGELSC